jgi:hypothetical protein
MTWNYLSIAIVSAWVLAIIALGVTLPMASIWGWAALIGLGLVPPLVVLRLWARPAQSMSERIQQALR